MSSDPTPGLGSLIISEQVLKQLSSLNPNKAYRPEQIPPWLLKTFDADIAPILTDNFQDSMINWLELFLTQRFQSVVCEGQYQVNVRSPLAYPTVQSSAHCSFYYIQTTHQTTCNHQLGSLRTMLYFRALSLGMRTVTFFNLTYGG